MQQTNPLNQSSTQSLYFNPEDQSKIDQLVYDYATKIIKLAKETKSVDNFEHQFEEIKKGMRVNCHELGIDYTTFLKCALSKLPEEEVSRNYLEAKIQQEIAKEKWKYAEQHPTEKYPFSAATIDLKKIDNLHEVVDTKKYLNFLEIYDEKKVNVEFLGNNSQGIEGYIYCNEYRFPFSLKRFDMDVEKKLSTLASNLAEKICENGVKILKAKENQADLFILIDSNFPTREASLYRDYNSLPKKSEENPSKKQQQKQQEKYDRQNAQFLEKKEKKKMGKDPIGPTARFIKELVEGCSIQKMCLPEAWNHQSSPFKRIIFEVCDGYVTIESSLISLKLKNSGNTNTLHQPTLATIPEEQIQSAPQQILSWGASEPEVANDSDASKKPEQQLLSW